MLWALFWKLFREKQDKIKEQLTEKEKGFVNETRQRLSHPIRLRQNFFSKNEYKLYKCLDEIVQNTEEVDLFAKTRWEDVWNSKRGNEYHRYRGFLKSRHVDFLILRSTTNRPYILIELTDRSHARPDRKERNERLEQFCEDTGLHLLWIKTKSQYDQEGIRKKIRECLKSKEVVVCHM